MHGQPRPARYLSDLTPKMSVALVRCHEEVVLLEGGLEKHKIHEQTINALHRRVLVEKGRDSKLRHVWKPTGAGLRLILADEPRLLAARSQKGYTTEPGQAMWPDAGEAVPESTITGFVTVNAERHAAIKGGIDQDLFTEQRTLEQRLMTLKKLAQERGVNVRSELRIVERGLDALERKIRDQRRAA